MTINIRFIHSAHGLSCIQTSLRELRSAIDAFVPHTLAAERFMQDAKAAAADVASCIAAAEIVEGDELAAARADAAYRSVRLSALLSAKRAV